MRSTLLLLTAAALARANQLELIVNGQAQPCTTAASCPPGNTCTYSPLYPGVKICVRGQIGACAAFACSSRGEQGYSK